MLRNILIIIGILLVGVAIGRYAIPPKTTTKTETVVKHETDTKYIDRTITTPGGIVTVEHEVVKIVKDESDKKQLTVIEATRHMWQIGGGVENITQLSKPVYTINIDRRFIGPIFLGASGTTDGKFGIRASLEF